jgi:hypothetical protein
LSTEFGAIAQRSLALVKARALSDRELATVLAGLRSFQRYGGTLDLDGTAFDVHAPLSSEEIDALCKRLSGAVGVQHGQN